MDWRLERYFGEVVVERRLELGLSQEEVASRSGLSISAIQKYEAGEREPRARAILQLADALEISADALFKHSRWVRPSLGDIGHFDHPPS